MFPVRSTLRQARQFSSTSRSLSVLDYFKFFKKKTPSNTPQPKQTAQVIEEVKNNQDKITSEAEIEIIGKKNPRYYDEEVIAENLKGFSEKYWIQGQSIKQGDVSELLASIFNQHKVTPDDKPIDNLYLRFAIFKAVQERFGVFIPDSKFTFLDSYAQFESTLQNLLDPALKTTKKNEFQPDAVDFNLEEYKGTNVHITKHVFKSEKEKKYAELLEKAKLEEEKSLENYKSSNSTSSVWCSSILYI